jgi:probable rRNA maturation factor
LNLQSPALKYPSKPVNFYFEDIRFRLNNRIGIRQWLCDTAMAEKAKCKSVSIIFCSDNYLLELNRNFLKHDYYTDIITFNHAEIGGNVEGDLFISVDRVRDNATSIGVFFVDEMHRVIIHGILHLLGYRDKTKADQLEMRQKEEYYLSLRAFS